MSPTDHELTELDEVLAITERIVRGVRPHQARHATPCQAFDVGQLVDHVLTWTETYASRLTGEPAPDAEPYLDPLLAGDRFTAGAAGILRGYRSGGPVSEELPVGVLLMDYCTHGWDLARATGQVAPYPDSAVDLALEVGHRMLTPALREQSSSFGPEVTPGPDAPPLDRLVAFLGRDPAWTGR